MVKFVVLLSDGDIKDVELKLKADDRNKPFKNILRFKKKIELFTSNLTVGNGKITEIHRWSIGNNKLVAYGYLKGITKNNHELPILDESKNNKVYYEDIMLIKLNNNNILLDFNTDEYEEMYNDLYYNKDVDSQYEEEIDELIDNLDENDYNESNQEAEDDENDNDDDDDDDGDDDGDNTNSDEEIKILEEPKNCKSNYWLQTIVLGNKLKKDKNSIIKKGNLSNIGMRPCWKPLHTLKHLKKYPKMNLNNAEEIYERIINIPSSSHLKLND